MATSKHSGTWLFRSPRGSARGEAVLRVWLRRAVLVLLSVAAIALAWNAPSLRERALANTAYGARMACACHYIGGRDLSACRSELLPGMGLVSLWEDEASHAITARVPLIASQTAYYQRGPGCVLESWR